MKTAEGTAIFAVIKQRNGAENAINAVEICHRLGWPAKREREVRQRIADEAALWPQLVCATPGKGYFIPETYEELERYDNWLGNLVRSAELKRAEFRESARHHGFRLRTERIAA